MREIEKHYDLMKQLHQKYELENAKENINNLRNEINND